MACYLAAVGALGKAARDVDLAHAFSTLLARAADDEAREALAIKQTLLLRPLERLLGNPHLLAGFIGRHEGRSFCTRKGKAEPYSTFGFPWTGKAANELTRSYPDH